MATAARYVARSIKGTSLENGRRGAEQYICRDPSNSPLPPTTSAEQKLYKPKSVALRAIAARPVASSLGREKSEIMLPISESRAVQILCRISGRGARTEIDWRSCSSAINKY